MARPPSPATLAGDGVSVLVTVSQEGDMLGIYPWKSQVLPTPPSRSLSSPAEPLQPHCDSWFEYSDSVDHLILSGRRQYFVQPTNQTPAERVHVRVHFSSLSAYPAPSREPNRLQHSQLKCVFQRRKRKKVRREVGRNPFIFFSGIFSPEIVKYVFSQGHKAGFFSLEQIATCRRIDTVPSRHRLSSRLFKRVHEGQSHKAAVLNLSSWCDSRARK